MVSELEKEALKQIMKRKTEGIPQNELWKILDTTSREGYRISTKLEKSGLVRRVKELHKGRWTYRLFPIIKEPKKITWNNLNDCPCFICKDLNRCGIGQQISPIYCKKQNEWIEKCKKEKELNNEKVDSDNQQ
ncbi:MAG: helix-turn-helix transcriptional regulator [Candidatus Odinarchaeia archaeon]